MGRKVASWGVGVVVLLAAVSLGASGAAGKSLATPTGTSCLTVTSSDGGSVVGGDVDCRTDSDDCEWDDLTTGSTVTLIEFPDIGYSFGNWGGGCTGSANHCTLTMDTDRSLSA